MNAVQLTFQGGTAAPVVRDAHCVRCGVLSDQPACPACCDRIAQEIVAGGGFSAATRTAYRTAWASWTAWSAARGRDAVPVDGRELAAWLVQLGTGHRWTTVRARYQAVLSVARSLGHQVDREPARRVLAWLRTATEAPSGGLGCAPIVRSELALAIETIDSRPGGDPARTSRDRAILLVGWSIAARPSELAGLRWSDVRWPASSGWPVAFLSVKRRKVGQVQEVPINRASDPKLDPLAALETLRAGDPIGDGPLFWAYDRHGVRRSALGAAGVSALVGRLLLDAGIAGRSGHGLRAGLVTEAARAGVPLEEIRRITGHAGSRSLELYVKRSEAIDSRAGRLL